MKLLNCSHYIGIIITLFVLYFNNSFKDGRIGNLSFEILQIIYIVLVFKHMYSINYKMGISLSIIVFIVHIIRFFNNYKKIIKLQEKNKYLSYLINIFIIYLISNNFNTKYQCLLGIIYFIFAYFSLVNTTKKITKAVNNLIHDIPMTISILYIMLFNSYLIPPELIPICIGDLLYHTSMLIK